MTTPIDSMEELVTSGLTWNMALYDEAVEEYMAKSDHPILRKFWDGAEFDYYNMDVHERVSVLSCGQKKKSFVSIITSILVSTFQMKNVYERESVMVNWKPYIMMFMKAGFTLPDGKQLMHTAYDLGLGLQQPQYAVWPFHPFNPWIKRFAPLLLRMDEGSIIFETRRIAR